MKKEKKNGRNWGINEFSPHRGYDVYNQYCRRTQMIPSSTTAHTKTFTAKQTIFSGLIFAKYMDSIKNLLKTNSLKE